MAEKYFWGDRGQYGPYSMQVDGWPNAGEVMRDYRLKMKMDVGELGVLYGNKVFGKPISDTRMN